MKQSSWKLYKLASQEKDKSKFGMAHQHVNFSCFLELPDTKKRSRNVVPRKT